MIEKFDLIDGDTQGLQIKDVGSKIVNLDDKIDKLTDRNRVSDKIE